MNTIEKPSIETFQLAMGEYAKKGKTENTKCERCNSIIQIKPKGDSALLMSCECGLYNDNLRGL